MVCCIQELSGLYKEFKVAINSQYFIDSCKVCHMFQEVGILDFPRAKADGKWFRNLIHLDISFRAGGEFHL